jgi:adenylate cyclase
MPLVTFLPYDIRLEVPRGTSVLAAADEAAEMVPDDFFVGELCEGRHECGNCCIEIVAGAESLSPVTQGERKLLAELKAGPAVRSACTARVLADVTVRILAPVRHPAASGDAQMQAHP